MQETKWAKPVIQAIISALLLGLLITCGPCDKYFVKGKVETQAEESYTSHNTNRLDVDGVVKKILTTDYVQEELRGMGINKFENLD